MFLCRSLCIEPGDDTGPVAGVHVPMYDVGFVTFDLSVYTMHLARRKTQKKEWLSKILSLLGRGISPQAKRLKMGFCMCFGYSIEHAGWAPR